MEKDEFSRAGKLFMDRDKLTAQEVRIKREGHIITLVVGDDCASAAGLQMAIATALNLASRVFSGKVCVRAPTEVLDAPCLVPMGKGKSFGGFLNELMPVRLRFVDEVVGQILCFGNGNQFSGLRVTFDGWIAKVGPVDLVSRLQERHWCPLAPILAAALAIGESFLEYHALSLEAGSRTLDLSLWNPLTDNDDERLGKTITHAPTHMSIIGLGHLGQAYLWAIAALNYAIPANVVLWLCDDDRVAHANLETGVLVGPGDLSKLKTRTMDRFCRRLGFETRLIERRIDDAYRRSSLEPNIVLSSVDSNEVRHWIARAGYPFMLDAGLGDSADNFDHIGLRLWPHARSPEKLWPLPTESEIAEAKRAAEEEIGGNRGYQAITLHDCGLIELMGVAIGVPYVGTVAACFTVASMLRAAMSGPRLGPGRITLGVQPDRYQGSLEGQHPVGDLRVLMPLGEILQT